MIYNIANKRKDELDMSYARDRRRENVKKGRVPSGKRNKRNK